MPSVIQSVTSNDCRVNSDEYSRKKLNLSGHGAARSSSSERMWKVEGRQGKPSRYLSFYPRFEAGIVV